MRSGTCIARAHHFTHQVIDVPCLAGLCIASQVVKPTHEFLTVQLAISHRRYPLGGLK
jgi:hypothetical protein